MELLVAAAIIGYIIYLRYYADLRTKSEKDVEKLQAGIQFYQAGQFVDALNFFERYLQKEPTSSVAYLYQAKCYRALGQLPKAIDALKKGESYDNTVADLHLEMGHILYDQQDYSAAYLEFDKAVFFSKGLEADAFQGRGTARQHLENDEQAQQDLNRAATLRESERLSAATTTPKSDVFFDRKLLSHTVVILINSVVLLVVIKNAPVIHLPYLLAAIAATVIGYLEPRKGWALAIIQAATLWVGYTFFTKAPQTSGARDLEAFGLYGSMILTFIGSFIGGVLKRQLIR